MKKHTHTKERDKHFNLNALVEACCERMEKEYQQHNRLPTPIPSPIIEITKESNGVSTIWIQVPTILASDYKPGQYFMCWNPYDSEGGMSKKNYNSEKPYSVGDIRVDRSGIDEETAPDQGLDGSTMMGFTIKNLGRQSGELIKMEKGDWFAIRGPFGTNFQTPNFGETLILVSGGIGSTPMHMAAKEARNKLGDKLTIHSIMGFQTSDDVHYHDKMREICDSVTVTTDDGSFGLQGYPTIPLREIITNCQPSNTKLFTCGPEPMMKPVLEICEENGIESYAAMERYLPCSVAACGLCMVGDRLTCRQGPVMEGSWLLEQDDFGSPHYH